MMKKLAQSQGFTLIEVLLVVSLISISLIVVSVNLIRPLPKAKLDEVSGGIVSTLHEAATKAGSGDTQGGPTSSEYGVHFETSSYTLFKGTTFVQGGSDNFEVSLPAETSLTPNLPCNSPPTDCNNIVFQKISAEVVNFSPSQNSLCVNDLATNKTTRISINFLGVVDAQAGC
jgi:prepilin-type N-terminal cleavage/methylation domain-containing protein